MTETPSHAELVAAIEQARIVNPLHSQPDYVDEHNAHLAVLTDILNLAADLDRMYVNVPQDLRATVATALRRMGAL